MANKSEIKSCDESVDIIALYRQMYTIDEIAEKVYAQMKRCGLNVTQAQARLNVEDAVLMNQRRKK